MASYKNLLQHTKHRFESPAKVFAKLKSKVQREATCAKEAVLPEESPPVNVREKHEADRRRTESTWMTDVLKDNRSGCYREEVQVVTLSPISSPQETLGQSLLDAASRHVDRMTPVTEARCAFTSTDTTFLGSTSVSVANRKHDLAEPTPIRDLDACKTNRTPIKMTPVRSDCVRGVFEVEAAPKKHHMSPGNVYSPMKMRLRKRKWDQGFNKMSSRTKEINAEVVKQSHQRITSVLSQDDTHNNTATEDVRGFSTDRSQMSQFTQKRMFLTSRSNTIKGCFVDLETIPISPAKIFAYMKERESKRAQKEDHEVSSSTREPFSGGDFFQSEDRPLSTAHNKGEMGNRNSRSVPDATVPIKLFRVETLDTESHPSSEDVVVPAVPSHPVLFEDPLVLNSPHISIPKKPQAVFKHNKLPLCEELPNESVIYLKQWFLRKTRKGLFVDGIHKGKNIPWNSTIIVDRVSNSVVKTVSGRVYILVGKMKMDVVSAFPKWFLKKFANGFPPNWKELYEIFLSESRDSGTKKNSKERDDIAKKKSEASSVNVSVQQHRQKPLKTSASCPPVYSMKVSRSGRMIKPPLEYWKGGRVVLDGEMNVTIHECYDTVICNPVTTTRSTKKSQKPTRVFPPSSESKGNSCKEEVSAPLRKVKASRRICKKAKTDPESRPCNPSEPTVETVSIPDECSRRTKSSQRRPATVRISHLDTVTQKQTKSEKALTCMSAKLSRDTNQPPVRGRKQTVKLTTSPESLIEEPKNQTPPSSESLEISDKSEMTRTKVTKPNGAAQTQRKCNKTSAPTKPSLKSNQSCKKRKVNKGQTVPPQEQDEDRWTEAELNKLQQAVSCFPKHVKNYWSKVASLVGTRSAAECYHQHTSQGSPQTPASQKKARKSKNTKVEAPKDTVTDHPVISARAGTLKRKQQVRQFLEAMPKENVDDVFSSTYMQNKRFEIPSMCSSDDHDFAMSDLESLTPKSNIFPDVKTPQCLHITPSMMGSPNRTIDDKYVYQLQKRMKKNQFNVCKRVSTLKSFTPTPSVKQAMRICGNTENDSFVVWEMFPGDEGTLSESEEDFYFSDND